jgi:isopentenyl-diphosphate delta-isomerase
MWRELFNKKFDLKYKSHELLEVVDGKNKSLAVCPKKQILNQALPHKIVLVLVYDQLKSLYIQQRSFKQELYPGYWDVSAAGHVRAGESKEDSALRELNEELGITGVKLHLLYEIQASQKTDNTYISIFFCKLKNLVLLPNPKELEQGVFMEKHELDYFISNYLSIIAPSLLYLWHNELLFKI